MNRVQMIQNAAAGNIVRLIQTIAQAFVNAVRIDGGMMPLIIAVLLNFIFLFIKTKSGINSKFYSRKEIFIWWLMFNCERM
jgi:hypothetical protein